MLRGIPIVPCVMVSGLMVLGASVLLVFGILTLFSSSDRDMETAQYNSLVALYDPDASSYWDYGSIGGAHTDYVTESVVVVGSTARVTPAKSRYARAVLPIASGGPPTNVSFALSLVKPFSRAPAFTKPVVTGGHCALREGVCTNGTSVVCPVAGSVWSGPLACNAASSCGSCTYTAYLTTYCVALQRQSSGATLWEEDPGTNCFYRTDSIYANDRPPHVEFQVRQRNDPFIALQRITRGSCSFGEEESVRSPRSATMIAGSAAMLMLVVVCAIGVSYRLSRARANEPLFSSFSNLFRQVSTVRGSARSREAVTVRHINTASPGEEELQNQSPNEANSGSGLPPRGSTGRAASSGLLSAQLPNAASAGSAHVACRQMQGIPVFSVEWNVEDLQPQQQQQRRLRRRTVGDVAFSGERTSQQPPSSQSHPPYFCDPTARYTSRLLAGSSVVLSTPQLLPDSQVEYLHRSQLSHHSSSVNEFTNPSGSYQLPTSESDVIEVSPPSRNAVHNQHLNPLTPPREDSGGSHFALCISGALMGAMNGDSTVSAKSSVSLPRTEVAHQTTLRPYDRSPF